MRHPEFQLGLCLLNDLDECHLLPCQLQCWVFNKTDGYSGSSYSGLFNLKTY